MGGTPFHLGGVQQCTILVSSAAACVRRALLIYADEFALLVPIPVRHDDTLVQHLQIP